MRSTITAKDTLFLQTFGYYLCCGGRKGKNQGVIFVSMPVRKLGNSFERTALMCDWPFQTFIKDGPSTDQRTHIGSGPGRGEVIPTEWCSSLFSFVSASWCMIPFSVTLFFFIFTAHPVFVGVKETQPTRTTQCLTHGTSMSINDYCDPSLYVQAVSSTLFLFSIMDERRRDEAKAVVAQAKI